MLFLTIPLILIAITLLGVVVVVWRKISFLRRLTPESHEFGESWLHDMAPEVVDWYRGVPWHQYLHNALVETEKFLRRVRLLFSAFERLSEQLVHKVRHVHQETAKQVQEHREQIEAEKAPESDPDEVDLNDPEQLKQEEQRLIVTIAQSPKEASLYSDLARVYMKMRNFSDAVEALATAAKLEPENESYAKRLESAKKRLNLAQNVVQ